MRLVWVPPLGLEPQKIERIGLIDRRILAPTTISPTSSVTHLHPSDQPASTFMNEISATAAFHHLESILHQTLPSCALELARIPLCPSIQLALLQAELPQSPLPDDEMRQVIAAPAYWCFCWASGQVLAQYLLAHPERVAGKSVVDFGAGSGVVGIAARLAGASEVLAVDLDPAALAACAVNAAINGVQLTLATDLGSIQTPIDLIIAADVLYDRDNLHLLEALPTLATDVLIADSRIKNFNHPHYRLLQTQTTTTWPDLEEHPEYNQVRLFEHTRST